MHSPLNTTSSQKQSPSLVRPVISDYSDSVEFLKAMIEYRKKTEKSFSVMKATKGLRKVSSALVSLVLQKKRKLTLDRVDEFSKLMNLTSAEKLYFKNSLLMNFNEPIENIKSQELITKNKKEFTVSLLNDWLHVYVKDAFRIEQIQKNPHLAYKELASIASKTRIDKSLDFLLKEGYLRKTLDGRIVIETSLHTNETPPPGKKIRAFHKAALSIAKQNIDLFDVNERFANTMILDLTPERYQELTELIRVFSKSLQDFASVEAQNGQRLYQVVVNLSPTGGRSE